MVLARRDNAVPGLICGTTWPGAARAKGWNRTVGFRCSITPRPSRCAGLRKPASGYDITAFRRLRVAVQCMPLSVTRSFLRCHLKPSAIPLLRRPPSRRHVCFLQTVPREPAPRSGAVLTTVHEVLLPGTRGSPRLVVPRFARRVVARGSFSPRIARRDSSCGTW